MPQNYTPEFKKKIVRLHEEEGRTYKSITAEYGVSKASISKWCSQLVSAKYSCGFPDPQVLPIIVVERYLDYFTTIMHKIIISFIFIQINIVIWQYFIISQQLA